MRDDFYSPAWADSKHHLSGALGHSIHKLGIDVLAAFESLARQNYEAPWRVAQARRARHRH